jgi:hypothetical protein
MAERIRYAANLAFLALSHDDLEDGFLGTRLDDLDHARGSAFFVDGDAALPHFNRALAGLTQDCDEIRLGVAITRVRQLVGHLPVVGQHDQAFTVGVQATHGKQVLATRHQVVDCLAVVGGVGVTGRQNVFGLIQRNINLRLFVKAQRLAVQLNGISLGVRLRAKRDDLAIYRDAAL